MIRVPEQAHSFGLNLLEQEAPRSGHRCQFRPGIGQHVHPQPAKIGLIAGGAVEEGHLAVAEHDQQVGVATRHRVAPGQGAEEPNFFYFRMRRRQTGYGLGQAGSYLFLV
jgi:hypothetical protein